ncbi:hypothetical protein [Thermomonospora cellulosilytica]|uniref:Uncharacterized protein n=1 Tax=Thermomonospora cellulosilytica TaxID=1411118 RepID=A0A7W3N031_9ACTN|nr:hypothetical protein [Thermomonospora cellulosilytica]MBA9005002.1 hypothetical protein [Thermomonospora cellulosilytica]
MLGKLWEQTGERMAGAVLLRLLTPAGLFWGAGLGAWAWHAAHRPGGLRRVGADLAALPTVLQITLVVAILAAVLLTAAVTERLTLPLLRLLEGYWPWGLGDYLRSRLHRRRVRCRCEVKKLREAGKHAKGLSPRDKLKLARLLATTRNIPPELADTMPTRFGNRLRVAELRPRAKLGLDPVACWPHLWLLLDPPVKAELSQARAEMDMAAHAVWWSLAIVVWTPLAWWALPLGPAAAVAVYYAWLLPAAQNYGDLLQAAFDLFRWRLYRAARWPQPFGTADEPALGRQLTTYLAGRTTLPGLLFQPDPNQPPPS